jgi:hypothetical protein
LPRQRRVRQGFDKRMFRLCRPCGDSPRLRMSLGAAASEDARLDLAYSRLGLEGTVPDHSIFSKNP